MIDISGYLNNFSSTFVWLYSFLQSLHDSIVTTAQAKKKKERQKHGPELPKHAMFETETSKCRPR